MEVKDKFLLVIHKTMKSSSKNFPLEIRLAIYGYFTLFYNSLLIALKKLK